MDVRQYIDDHAAEFFGALKRVAQPSRRSPPTRRGTATSAGRPSGCAGHLRDTGFPVAEIWETGEDGDRGPARRVRRAGPPPIRPRRSCWSTATTTCSRSSRWRSGTARRSSRRARRPAARPRRLRRQGPGAVPRAGHRGRRWPRPARSAPPVTLKLLIEGEEESGSPHFADAAAPRAGAAGLRRHRHLRHHDVGRGRAVDVHRHARPGRRPRSSLRGPERDLHSGSFGGGVPNPLHVLAEPAGRRCTTSDGRVTLPGFYDEVRPLSDARAGADRPAAVRREGLAGRGGQQRRRRRRGGLQHAGADLGPADRRDQRHVGRPHRARRQDDHPGRRARQAVLPAGRRPGPGRRHRRAAAVRGRAHAAGHRGHGDLAAATASGRRSRHRGLGRRAGGPRGDAAGVRRREVLFTREGGSGPEADLADILGAPLVFVGGRPGRRPHPRPEREGRAWTSCSRAPRRPPTCGKSWPTRAVDGRTVSGRRRRASEARSPAARDRAGPAGAGPRRGGPVGSPARNDEAWLAAAWAGPDTRVLVGGPRPRAGPVAPGTAPSWSSSRPRRPRGARGVRFLLGGGGRRRSSTSAWTVRSLGQPASRAGGPDAVGQRCVRDHLLRPWPTRRVRCGRPRCARSGRCCPTGTPG